MKTLFAPGSNVPVRVVTLLEVVAIPEAIALVDTAITVPVVLRCDTVDCVADVLTKSRLQLFFLRRLFLVCGYVVFGKTCARGKFECLKKQTSRRVNRAVVSLVTGR